MATQSDPELQGTPPVIKPLPLVKIKRVRNGGYRVYKWINGAYKIKSTFYTMHQAQRYVKGFGEEAKKKLSQRLPKAESQPRRVQNATDTLGGDNK